MPLVSPTSKRNPAVTLNIQTNIFPLILVTSLFFFWGFIHNLDPILIPHLRKAFQLNDLQSSLIDSAVFIAYFLMALPAGYFIRNYGYKTGIVSGLFLFCIGSFLFLPAADTHQYIFFLGALFIIASGLTFLETAANPYTTLIGPPETATQRLNFAQSFNGLAVLIAPMIGGAFILSGKELSTEDYKALSPEALKVYLSSEAESVKVPYLVIGMTVLLVAILFLAAKLPDIKEEKEKHSFKPLQAFRYSHLSWAVIAQFFYVGAQVCVGSFFIKMARTSAGMDEKTAANFLGLGYGLAFMLGRFIGTFLMKYIKAERLLAIYAFLNILLCIIAIAAKGMIVVYALILISFFMSIMFPTIFSLGIKDLGKFTKPGSSLIVMSIVGGALLPPLLGLISDYTGNIQHGYVVPLLCFGFVLFFALKGHKVKPVYQ
ncbi:MAG: L-fucose:H+ symporter permease [Chitinophagales bacterium]|nr:L-fucose:H+ symporter permease [Chitinophagales bacterium]